MSLVAETWQNECLGSKSKSTIKNNPSIYYVNQFADIVTQYKARDTCNIDVDIRFTGVVTFQQVVLIST